MNIIISNLKEFHEHVITKFPEEAIGILKNNIFIPLCNISSDPYNNFLLSETDSFNLATTKDYILIHSHTMSSIDSDARAPSFEDMQSQNNLQVPFGIVYCDGEAVSDPIYFGPPSEAKLLGRTYIHNIYDCYTLCRDYYYRYFHIDIGLNPRPKDWEAWKPYALLEDYKKFGFHEVTGNYAKGDVLLYKISRQQPNHLGVVVGENTFIHHLYRRKSMEDSISKWNKHLVKVLRYDTKTI